MADSPRGFAKRIVGLKFSEAAPNQIRGKGVHACLYSDAFRRSITLDQIKGAKISVAFQRPDGGDTKGLQQQITIGFLPHPLNGAKSGATRREVARQPGRGGQRFRR